MKCRFKSCGYVTNFVKKASVILEYTNSERLLLGVLKFQTLLSKLDMKNERYRASSTSDNWLLVFDSLNGTNRAMVAYLDI